MNLGGYIMKSFKINTSEQSKIENIIKDVNYSIHNSSDKNFLSYRRDEKSCSKGEYCCRRTC